MSLKKIAAVKSRKRHFGTGGGGAESTLEGDGTDFGGIGGGGGTYGGKPGESNMANAGAGLGPAAAGKGEGYTGGEGAAAAGGFTPEQVAQIVADYQKMAPDDQDYQKATDAARMMSAKELAVANKIGAMLTQGVVTKGGSWVNDNILGRETRGRSVDTEKGIGVDGGDGRDVDHRDDGGTGNLNPDPFGGNTPVQTTPVPAPGSTGARRYVWDSKSRQYVIDNLGAPTDAMGAATNPMGYSQGQVFKMAAGGPVPATGLAAAAAMPRFVQGGGTGLSDSIPVQMDDGGMGRLGDGEFVVSADAVSGLGGGSSEAGARALYDMMERIRTQAYGSKQQVRPVNPQQVLPA